MLFHHQQTTAQSASTSDNEALLLDSSSNERHYNYGSTTTVTGQQRQQDDSSSSSSNSKSFGSAPWIVALIVAYTAERCTFKVLVDRSGPFRLFTSEAVIGTSTLFLGIQMLFALCRRSNSSRSSTNKHFSSIFQLPPVDLGLIVLLDSLQILLAFIGGSYVLPVLSVTLTQFTIPLVLFFTQLTHKHGSCNILHSYSRSCSSESEVDETDSDNNATAHAKEDSEQDIPNSSSNLAINASSTNEGNRNTTCETIAETETETADASTSSCGGYTVQHIFGAIIIFIAVILGLTPSTLYILNSPLVEKQQGSLNIYMVQRAWNTVLYASSFIPAAISQFLKEHLLTTYRQPVDMNELNITLSVLKFFAIGILSPFFYPLQGFKNNGATPLYSSRDMSANFQDAFLCTLGFLSDDMAENKYAEPASCGIFTWMLISCHVLSFMLLTLSVQKIVLICSSSSSNNGEQQHQFLVYQALITGLVVSSCVMWLYTIFDNQVVEHGVGLAGHHVIDILHASSFLLVVFGLELYHRNPIQDLTFETAYPEVEQFTPEEE